MVKLNSITLIRYAYIYIFIAQQFTQAQISDIQYESPVIERDGKSFLNSNTGEQFFLKGIAYQPQRTQEELEDPNVTFESKYIDPLADSQICLRDIPYLKKLDVNTIRVYSIDPTMDHDICMNALAEAGIYVLLDLAEPDISIVRDNPTWDILIWDRYKAVVDATHQYTNVLGFFAGNEVTNDKTNTDASPYVKAAIRDTKEYIKVQNYRNIPVGYATNDDADTREYLSRYFVCGEVVADFYGVNMYEWCGYSSYGTSGYRERTKSFENYPVPIFFSEFGCNLIRPRPFTEVGALFGQQMSEVWSGGLAYMYFEEENGYGVVKIDGDKVIELPDFKYLQNEFTKAQPKGNIKSGIKTLSEAEEEIECPFKDENWIASSQLPPTPNRNVCSCLENILPCQVVPFMDDGKYEEYFDFLCSQVNCTDIKTDGMNGLYGEYSYCTNDQKLSLLVSKLYYKSDTKEDSCPLQDSNVYFNYKFLDLKYQSEECLKINNNIKSHSSFKKSFNKNIGNPNSNTEKAPIKKKNSPSKHYDNDSGNNSSDSSSSRFGGSGYMILFMSIVIASVLL